MKALPFLFALFLTTTSSLAQSSVILTAYTSGDFRWKDLAGNTYSAAYQASYSYTQATVMITYGTNDTILSGTMSATNLKPNFAYQLKLSGFPTDEPEANENLGFSGRWWKEEWDGSKWANGWNLNDKRPGYFPNSNDVWYLSHKDDPDLTGTSPTGLKYRFTGYRPFDYFISDSNGNATVQFRMIDTYHVLWKTSQRTRDADDGPVKCHTFDPDPGFQPAYDTNYPGSTVEIFGEWERLPPGEIYLAAGSYTLDFLLTEESFHESGGVSGWWAHAAHGQGRFTIVRPLILATVDPDHGGSIVPYGSVQVEIGGDTNFSIMPADYWMITAVLVNGESVGATSDWEFVNVTSNQSIVVEPSPMLAAKDIPKWWLAEQKNDWTNDFDAAVSNDSDLDGMLTWQEYLAGTIPTDSDSVFRITQVDCLRGTNVLKWLSPVRDPALPPFGAIRSTNLTQWTLVDSNIAASPDGTNLWYDTETPSSGGPVFCRLVATNSP